MLMRPNEQVKYYKATYIVIHTIINYKCFCSVLFF